MAARCSILCEHLINAKVTYVPRMYPVYKDHLCIKTTFVWPHRRSLYTSLTASSLTLYRRKIEGYNGNDSDTCT